jgi:DNA-binding CsgD family transcriptional regulator
MSVRYRPLRPNDIPTFMEHFSRHPILSRRYGRTIQDLPKALKHTFREDYTVVNIFEESTGNSPRFLGAGMAAFVHEEFIRAVKTTPDFWLGPELVNRIVSGESPLLSESALRNANEEGELSLVVWHSSCHPHDFVRMDVAPAIMTAFEETFRGFQMREIFAQADSLPHLEGIRHSGGLYFDRVQGDYGAFPDVSEANFSEEPRNAGITRELATRVSGCTWVASMFAYGMPQFGFNASEQRLLLFALKGGDTDEALSDALGISVSGVKKTWRSIYERVADRDPELCPSHSGEDQAETRGKQKKQRLLAYLREHPEELRPFSRKRMSNQRAH